MIPSRWSDRVKKILSVFRSIRVYTEKDSIPGLKELPQGMLHVKHCIALPGMNALYDTIGNILPESCLHRGTPPVPLPKAEYKEVVDLPITQEWPVLENVIFLPFINFDHFGHALTETAGWLYPISFAKPNEMNMDGNNFTFLISALHISQIPFLASYLNITLDRIISTGHLSGGIRLSNVWIPQPTFINRYGMHPNHLKAVRYFIRNKYGLEDTTQIHKRGNEKVYLSRTKLEENNRKIRGELNLELYLKLRGWKIVHPETLPISEQVSILNHARVIGGNPGSAFHLIMYFGIKCPAPLVIALGREQDFLSMSSDQNMIYHLQAQDIPLRYICCLELYTHDLHFSRNSRNQHRKFLFSERRIAQLMDHTAITYLRENP